MNDRHDYFDYESLVREARMERSLAVGRAIANGVGALSALVRRGVGALSRSLGRSDSGSIKSTTASAHR